MAYVIFGGTGGIGAAVARALVADGRRVHLVARDPGRLAALADALDATWSAADVTDAGAVQAAVEAAGPVVEGLVYAVGTIHLRPFGRLTDADLERDFQINALGAARAVRAALPGLKAAPGTASVLLFSTVAVGRGFPAHASVAMAKGAVEGLTRALAAELAPKIRVNALAPSLTRTPLARGLLPNDTVAASLAALHPLGRLGEPEDLAPLALTLLTDRGAWITGQVISVDGGRGALVTPRG